VREILLKGFELGDKHFHPFGASSSQLRSQGYWFILLQPHEDKHSLLEQLGNFRKLNNVAQYVARIGQCLSSTIPTITLKPEEIEDIADIKTEDGRYNFTDGIGRVSKEAQEKIAEALGSAVEPSLFQIRCGGVKGVIALDPHLKGIKLLRRESMIKFESEDTTIEVISTSTDNEGFLNRQVI
jgi:RNA-dependent RNA polymerase